MRLLDVGPLLKLHSSKTFKLACLGKGTFVYLTPETQALFTAECFQTRLTIFFLNRTYKTILLSIVRDPL